MEVIPNNKRTPLLLGNFPKCRPDSHLPRWRQFFLDGDSLDGDMVHGVHNGRDAGGGAGDQGEDAEGDDQKVLGVAQPAQTV